jgi:hypothetical protein
MSVFDIDGRRILAQHDDAGGLTGLPQRIDFFPPRDDWYYAQSKNAGRHRKPRPDVRPEPDCGYERAAAPLRHERPAAQHAVPLTVVATNRQPARLRQQGPDA